MEKDKPDFEIDRLKELFSKEVAAVVSTLVKGGWLATHIGEYKVGHLAVWLCIRHRKTSLSVHDWSVAYVTGEAVVKRVMRKSRSERVQDD